MLFVSSGNSIDGISPIIKSQGESLILQKIQLEFFTIKGKGLWSYFCHIFILHKFIKLNKYDIIHAHYSLSAFVASLAGAKPIVVSLMGSDVKSNIAFKNIIHLFAFIFRWRQIIVKSEEMKNSLCINKVKVIPNGVDTIKFKPINKLNCQEILKWDSSKKHILFAANPNRLEKNFDLVSKAFSILNNPNIELHVLENVPHNEIPTYMNSSDIVILSSQHEGSPNVIKEAMAFNRPIVATNVGDIEWVFGNTEGCYLTSFDPIDVAGKLKLALEFSALQSNTTGRERIMKIGLDSETVAKKIIELYKIILN